VDIHNFSYDSEPSVGRKICHTTLGWSENLPTFHASFSSEQVVFELDMNKRQ
jgi:hypothetical protein